MDSSDALSRSRCRERRLKKLFELIQAYNTPAADLPCRVCVEFEIVRVETASTMSTSSTVDRSRPDFVQLRSESARLSTFDDWPLSAGRIVQPRDLAAAGLFYTGHADRVQCAFCRGCLRRWREGDVPAQEHRRHFPDCPLVHDAASGSITTRLQTNSASSTLIPTSVSYNFARFNPL